MITENTLHILFRRIQPEAVIQHWLDAQEGQLVPLSIKPDHQIFNTALQNEFKHYSSLEAKYVYDYFDSRNNDSVPESLYKSFGIFGVVAESVKDYLILDPRRECLCKYTRLRHFRELTHTIDSMFFVAAHLAMCDQNAGERQRDVFSWPPTVRTDNVRLHHILDKGMAENHFHIGGSVDPFAFSWICLMNHYTSERKSDFAKFGSDTDPLDTIRVGSPMRAESSYLLTFKAACIRYYLYRKLTGTLPPAGEDDKDSYRDWIEARMRVSSDEECDLYTNDLNQRIQALATDCVSEFNDGFIPDYAIGDEPLPPMMDDDLPYYGSLAVRNYERRLYRPLAGEQKFMYLLFRAVFSSNPLIQEDLDLAYAYLLIYCRIRGELVQVNDRVGFSNFLKYQNRKDILMRRYQRYGQMCTQIAEQVVLANPQVASFEGRTIPADTAKKMINKIDHLFRGASVSQYAGNTQQAFDLKEKIKRNAERKMHYVLHFPKESELVSDKEYEERSNPRNSKKREDTRIRANAIIEAMQQRHEVMSRVTGIDACSEEIDCRPEVFACQFRRLRQHRVPFTATTIDPPFPSLRITYHAGEDFLDPIDGLRAISEAIRFCDMTEGDRLGHALALGVDLEEWYSVKERHVLLRKQAILDNLVWLYGQMHQYNIENPEAEGYIQKYFKKYFTEIYTRNVSVTHSLLYSVDVMDYYASFGLRGNDPYLYINNPEGNDGKNLRTYKEGITEAKKHEPWRVLRETDTYDELSDILYHYYHFNYEMKKASDGIDEIPVPRCIIEAACTLQEKMRYDISSRNIGIECNPSSNFLIGTFKDYSKHPIFRFNNRYLFPHYDPRSQERNPYILASINTDDLGIFNTSLENEYALIACALEEYNEYCRKDQIIPPDNIYKWLDNIRQNGLEQSFIRVLTSSYSENASDSSQNQALYYQIR